MSNGAGHERTTAELAKSREDMLQLCKNFLGDALPVDQVSDRSITGPNGDIPIRIYQPAHDAPLPLMVYFHGGGFAYGSVASHDTLVRRYASTLQAVIVSVDYRLAPEHKYPAGLQDCHAATLWAHEHARELGARPETLCVAGDSAGGNLSAVTAMMARDRCTPPVAFQLMVCPCCDDPRSASYASYSLGTDESMPSHKSMIDVYNLYVPNVEDGKQAYVSPIHAEDLSGLPPALIFTAGKDMLMDEAEAYAAKLADAGVDVTLKRFKDNVHVGMSSPVPSARDCKLALDLIKAQWEHACTADDAKPSIDHFKLKATEPDATSAEV